MRLGKGDLGLWWCQGWELPSEFLYMMGKGQFFESQHWLVIAHRWPYIDSLLPRIYPQKVSGWFSPTAAGVWHLLSWRLITGDVDSCQSLWGRCRLIPHPLLACLVRACLSLWGHPKISSTKKPLPPPFSAEDTHLTCLATGPVCSAIIPITWSCLFNCLTWAERPCLIQPHFPWVLINIHWIN